MNKHYKLILRKKNYNLLNYYLYRYNRIFIGSLIKRGRKLWAFNFYLKFKSELKKLEKFDPNIIFLFSLLKITPTILLCPYKIGGKNEGIPLPISINKKMTFVAKWTISLLRKNNKRLKIKDLIKIMIDSIYNKGSGYKSKIEYYNEGIKNKFLIKYYKW